MAGRLSGAGCAQYFVGNGLENSANYCIGPDGDISCNVPEEYGAWTSSFSLADKYAITIEVSDTGAGDWRIPSGAQEGLIKLMVDLIQRYPSLGGKAVFDPTDEGEVVAAKRAYRNISCDGNVLLHRWTSAYGTTCPEWHMTQILPEICKEVNRRLAGGGGDTKPSTIREAAQYMIDNKVNGQARINKAKEWGYDPTKLQGEIDTMLGKDTAANIGILINNMPAVASGSEGLAVTILQAELKRLGYYTGTIDGQAGSMTVEAIKACQTNWNKVYSMAVDGSFGPACWTRLFLGK